MSGHLREEEFDEVLMGAASVQQQGHLETCSVCRQQLEALQHPLDLFRAVLTEAAQARPTPVREVVSHFWTAWRAGWAVVLAAGCAVVAGVVLSGRPATVIQPKQEVAGQQPVIAPQVVQSVTEAPALQVAAPEAAKTKDAGAGSKKQAEVQDTALLAEIDNHVSQRVPSALSPLADLVMPSEAQHVQQGEMNP